MVFAFNKFHINIVNTIFFLTVFGVLILSPDRAMSQQDSIVSKSDDLSIDKTVPNAVRPIHPLTDMSRLTDDTIQKWQFHLSMGGAYIGSKFSSASVFGITPSIVYRPNDRLKVHVTGTMIDSYSLSQSGYRIRGREPRNLAPLRNPTSFAGSVNVSATYRVGERLWLAASLMHVGGQVAPGVIVNPWLMPDMPVELNATAFTAAMRYRIGNNSYLDLHMTFIDDRTGAFSPYLWGDPHPFAHDNWSNYCDPFLPHTFTQW